MSGKPNPDGVKDLKIALKGYSDARRQVVAFEQELERVQNSLEDFRTTANDLRATIDRLLNEMDVQSPGNFGWEQRYLELLVMLSTVGQ